MKRSKIANLILMSAAPVTLVACGEKAPEVKKVIKEERFTNVQECMAAGKQDQICAESYLAALHRHRELAPKYLSQSDCEGEFTPGGCVATEEGKFVPKMPGFTLMSPQAPVVAPAVPAPQTHSSPQATTTVQQVSPEAPAAAPQPATTNVTNITNTGGGGSGGGMGDFLTGVLLGNAMSSNGGSTHTTVNNYSDPVYKREDRSGGSSSNLRQYEDSGYKPAKTSQPYTNARTGNYYDNSKYRTSSSSSSYEKPAPRTSYSVSSSTSRGGFGSMGSARSGWGG